MTATPPLPPPRRSGARIPLGRNVAEYAAIGAWWALLFAAHRTAVLGSTALSVVVVVGAVAKAALFGGENMQQLMHAVRSNMPHHRFLLLMGINMSQMVVAFAFDFHLLQSANPASFSGIDPAAGTGEVLFDAFYLSALNFSFFGYSDILPQTVAARLVNLVEIVLAFATVIFLLSDFISLKESLRQASDD